MKSSPTRHGIADAQTHDRHGVALRPETAQPATRDKAAQVLGEQRPLAHGVDARLGPGLVRGVRNIPGREDLLVGRGLEVFVDCDETRRVGVEPRFGEPLWRLDAGGPKRVVDGDRRVSRDELPFVSFGDPRPGHHGYAPFS